MKIKIGVLFGGKSVEHELSILTAIQAMDQIDSEKYEVIPIYITKNLEFYTGGMLRYIDSYRDFNLIKRYAKKVDLVNRNSRFILQTTNHFKKEYNEIHMAFPIVHGAKTEDGTLQGYLQLLGIPCIGNSIYASAVGQDKVFMRQILESSNLPLTNYVWFFDTDYINNKEELFKKINDLKYPLILKPATLGSSIGIEIIKQKEELESAIEKAIKYDNKILIEEAIENLIEYTCSVLGNSSRAETSDIEEIIKNDGIKKYSDKILKPADLENNENLVRNIPADISNKLQKDIEEYSKETFRLLNLKGIASIDFLYDKTNKKLYVDEVNTIPNYFSHHLWENKNVSYKEIINYLITQTLKDVNKEKEMTLTIDNNVIDIINPTDIQELK